MDKEKLNDILKSWFQSYRNYIGIGLVLMTIYLFFSMTVMQWISITALGVFGWWFIKGIKKD